MTHRALIGIGSNLGSAAENCKRAISLLSESESISLIAQSALYQSEPIGKVDQPWFVNAAIVVHTSLSPENLLQFLLNIEQLLGRIRNEKWGPRIIDLDILDYDGRIINSKTLALPHPEMIHRRFVLEPLSEIAGSTIHPLKEKTILSLLNELPPIPVVKKLQAS
ncbi:MAG: 2-amino-4-hydroxy-6-hydroxymethyldihydropteridine diphosphokinase [Nitrospinae bacterium]|nr:2-amino-4-hydroxy-6-hydroxymethyldihydropteridine diphosphokinase [Nitrospinota bacterium]